jgi:hypothetical protein
LAQPPQGCRENHCFLQDLEAHLYLEHHWHQGVLGYPAKNCLKFLNIYIEKVIFSPFTYFK